MLFPSQVHKQKVLTSLRLTISNISGLQVGSPSNGSSGSPMNGRIRCRLAVFENQNAVSTNLARTISAPILWAILIPLDSHGLRARSPMYDQSKFPIERIYIFIRHAHESWWLLITFHCDMKKCFVGPQAGPASECVMVAGIQQSWSWFFCEFSPTFRPASCV